MKFVTPKELSNQFWTSLKTIYNHINKHKGDIRTRKENWKTFVHFEDFKTVYTGGLQSYNTPFKENDNSQSNRVFEDSEQPTSKLQEDFQKLENRVTDLSKYNSNLQDQVSKYALLLTEEKNEKKEMFTKLTNLQKEVNQKIESHGNEKVFRTKRYYIILGICIVLCIVSIIVVLPWLLDFLFSSGIR